MNTSSKSNGLYAADCGSSCMYALMPLSTRHVLCKERRTVLERSASGNPNLAGDVGALSLLVRKGGDASLCDDFVVQFGHTLDFFAFCLIVRNMPLFSD
jgi:hypothetical protein